MANDRSENREQITELISKLNGLLDEWDNGPGSGALKAATVEPQVVKATARLTLLLAEALGHDGKGSKDESGS